jgi:hypothetical protein
MTTYTKVPLKGYDNDLPKYKPIVYAQPPEESGLPKNYFVSVCVGMRQSGKTVSTVKLIKYYEEHGVFDKDGNECPLRTIIVSPTFRSNPIFLSLKSLDVDNDVYENYSDPLLLEILDEIEEQRIESIEYQKKLKTYHKFLKVRSTKQLSPAELLTLYTEKFEKPVPPKYPFPAVVHIIFDDLIGTASYKQNGKSALNNLVVKNRHTSGGVNLHFLIQTAKQCPKLIRTNASLLLLYRYNSDELLKDLYECVSGVLTPEEFETLYNSCTEEKFNFMCVDCTHKDIKIKQNWNFEILLNKKNKVEKPKKKKDKEIKDNV